MSARPTDPFAVPEAAPTHVATADHLVPAAPAAPVEAVSVAEPVAPVAPVEPPAAVAPPEPPAPVAIPEPVVAVAAAAIPEPPAAVAEPSWSAAGSAPLGGLFDPRPDDYLPRETYVAEAPAPAAPVEVTIAESPYYERTSPFGLDPAPPAPSTALESASADSASVDSTGVVPTLDSQGEFLRLLEVVTSMCDHVIEYIEADRAERRQMMEMLTQLGRVITEGSTAAVAAFTALANANANLARPLDVSAAPPVPVGASAPPEPRERVIGGSMEAGPAPAPAAVPAPAPAPAPAPVPVPVPVSVSVPAPEPDIDLVAAESPDDPAVATLASAKIHIAVEVRGQFGDRWVDGFEICEVMTTPSGPRYRLRRQRDGVVLPELFDATNIRHAEKAEPTAAVGADEQASRERSMGSHPSGSNGDSHESNGSNGTNGTNGSNGDSAPVNGSGYWSRS